jgi:hypothetical protein
MFNDKRYSIITSDDTGRAWLDRNLGATQACAHITDSDISRPIITLDSDKLQLTCFVTQAI